MAMVRDGTSNTFFAGEMLADCSHTTHREWGWYENQADTNAMASTAVPLNVYTTCVKTDAEAAKRLYIHPTCSRESNGGTEHQNFLFGYRSYHPAGANFLMGDGSVQFINNDINYEIYMAYGGRNDGLPVAE